jgi:hypothetical protein
VPFSTASRCFLTAALVHLSVAGILVLTDPESLALTVRLDLVVWSLLVGFIGFSALGFALHLFPPISRRLMPAGPLGMVSFLLAETGLVLGALALADPGHSRIPQSLLTYSSALLVGAVALLVYLFGAMLSQARLTTPGPEQRPGDSVTIPLFLASWTSAVGAFVLFGLAGLGDGPGFGWWIAAVHLYVLGHVILLITAVSLRLVPRSLDADVPRPVAYLLGGLGTAGALLVPVGMLTTSPGSAGLLDLLATPEAAFALLFLAVLAYLGGRARTPRPQLALHLTSVTFLVFGGGLGLWMVSQSDYAPVVAHALLNILGFSGLTILFMWFGMIAPFQRISHAWTRRMMWALSGGWLVAVLALAAVGSPTAAPPGWVAQVAGGLLLGVALSWGAGTIPVLYPKLNPLPWMTSDRIRKIRERRTGQK